MSNHNVDIGLVKAVIEASIKLDPYIQFDIFLENLKRNDNKPLIESIQKGTRMMLVEADIKTSNRNEATRDIEARIIEKVLGGVRYKGQDFKGVKPQLDQIQQEIDSHWVESEKEKDDLGGPLLVKKSEYPKSLINNMKYMAYVVAIRNAVKAAVSRSGAAALQGDEADLRIKDAVDNMMSHKEQLTEKSKVDASGNVVKSRKPLRDADGNIMYSPAMLDLIIEEYNPNVNRSGFRTYLQNRRLTPQVAERAYLKAIEIPTSKLWEPKNDGYKIEMRDGNWNFPQIRYREGSYSPEGEKSPDYDKIVQRDKSDVYVRAVSPEEMKILEKIHKEIQAGVRFDKNLKQKAGTVNWTVPEEFKHVPPDQNPHWKKTEDVVGSVFGKQVGVNTSIEYDKPEQTELGDSRPLKGSEIGGSGIDEKEASERSSRTAELAHAVIDNEIANTESESDKLSASILKGFIDEFIENPASIGSMDFSSLVADTWISKMGDKVPSFQLTDEEKEKVTKPIDQDKAILLKKTRFLDEVTPYSFKDIESGIKSLFAEIGQVVQSSLKANA